MHNGFELQLQTMNSTPSEPKGPKATDQNLAQWTGAFNTSLLTTRAQHVKDHSPDLAALMKTPEFESILVAAQDLAIKENLTQEEATERLIDVFRKLDYSWKQIIISRGLSSLIDKT